MAKAQTPKPKRARNDAVLNTGLTSAADRRMRERQEALHNKHQEQSKEFTFGGEAILQWIEEERANVIEDLAKLPMSVETTEENVKSELRAFQMHLNFLARFKVKARKELRVAERNDEKFRKEWLKKVGEQATTNG